MAAFNWQLALLPLQVVIFPANAVLVATTRHYGAATLHLVESGLNLSLSLWWVQPWGLSGVIAGTVVARILNTAWYVPLAAFATLHIRPKAVLRTLWPAALLGFGAAVAAMSLESMQRLQYRYLRRLPLPSAQWHLAYCIFSSLSAARSGADWLRVLFNSGSGFNLVIWMAGKDFLQATCPRYVILIGISWYAGIDHQSLGNWRYYNGAADGGRVAQALSNSANCLAL